MQIFSAANSNRKMDASNIMLLLFLNVFVASYIVYADIIRDDGFNKFKGQFHVVHKGRMLRVLMSFNNIELPLCAVHCVQHRQCRTINYHDDKRDCELTDEDFDEMNVDMFTPGWYNYGTPSKVNGGWSRWRNLTECSKKCGNGTMDQWRDCDSPKADYGGADCVGIKRRTMICNTHQCETVNVALGKTAEQSSTFNPTYPASNAVDGLLYGAHTNYELEPWWEVNFGEVREIKEVYLNAYVSSKSYNADLSVITRTSEVEDWIVCNHIGDLKERITTFNCDRKSTNAQFLKIQSSTKCHLYIYEVKVMSIETVGDSI